jgi:hypothetical protein
MSHMHDPSPRTCHKLQQTHPPPSDHSNNIWQGEPKKKITVQFYPLSCHFLPLKKIGNFSLSMSQRHTGRVEVWPRSFLTWAISPLGENPAIYWIKGRVDPRSGLNVLEKGYIRTLDHPTSTLVTTVTTLPWLLPHC